MIDLGIHKPNDGEGLTIQDTIDMLKQIAPKARRFSYLNIVDEECNIRDVIGMGIGQSDQAEKHELKVNLLLDDPAPKRDVAEQRLAWVLGHATSLLFEHNQTETMFWVYWAEDGQARLTTADSFEQCIDNAIAGIYVSR